MKPALGDKEYSLLKPPLPFIWVCNDVGNPLKCVAPCSITQINHLEMELKVQTLLVFHNITLSLFFVAAIAYIYQQYLIYAMNNNGFYSYYHFDRTLNV